jgi:hypothetical protein
MARPTVRSKPVLQVVLQGEARQLRQGLDLSNIAYEVLDQPGPLILRVAVADWRPICVLAAERGYTRPNFFSQSDAIGNDAFSRHWLQQPG